MTLPLDRSLKPVFGGADTGAVSWALVVGLVLVAAVAASAQASTPSPKVQATRLAAVDHSLMKAFKAEEKKLARLANNLNAASHCDGAGQIPKNQQQAAIQVLFTYMVIYGAEKVSPLYIRYDRELGALHLTDGPLEGYVSAVHRFAITLVPLASARSLAVCTALANWRRAGYPNPADSVRLDAVYALNKAQAAAFASMIPASKPVIQAKAKADARLRALGVKPQRIPING